MKKYKNCKNTSSYLTVDQPNEPKCLVPLFFKNDLLNENTIFILS